jgi:hypothetical protein
VSGSLYTGITTWSVGIGFPGCPERAGDQPCCGVPPIELRIWVSACMFCMR